MFGGYEVTKLEFYKERETSGISSIIETHENIQVKVDILIEKIKYRKPVFIFENLISADKLKNYSMIGLETIDIDYKKISAFYDNKKKYGHEFSSSKSNSPFIKGIIGYISYQAIEDLYNIELNNKSSLAKYEFKLPSLLIVIDHTDLKLHIICNSIEEDSPYVSSAYDSNGDPDIEYKADSYETVIHKIKDLRKIIFSKEKVINNTLASISNNGIKDTSRIDNLKTIKFKSLSSRKKFIEKVDKAKKYISDGDIFQVVLSEQYYADAQIDEYELYKNLKKINNSTYKSLINFNEITSICTSPETLVRKTDKYVETFPIAGTRAIKNDNKDLMREKELKNDEKELAEHLMLVDLGRNDISKVCKASSVYVKEFCKIKKFSRVMHLVSRVEGEPKDSLKLLDCIDATFPAGTVTGAPKLRAMQIIDELEDSSRGLYAGSIAIIDDKANIDTCIAIRTIQIKDKKIIIQAGAGIVKDSIGEHEYTEILNKSKAMFEAVEMTNGGEVEYDFTN